MEIILPDKGKRIHVGMFRRLYIRLFLYLDRHFSANRLFHAVRMTAAFGLVMIIGFMIVPFSHSSLNAAPGVVTPSATTLTMVMDHENASVNILPIDFSGTFATSSDTETAKFNVTTNNFTGYELKLKGSDDTKRLINTTATAHIDSIDTIITPTTFDTATYNNKWGFISNKYNSATNTSYIPAPTTTDLATLDATSTANSTAIDYTLGVGARIDATKPAGTYSNTFILIATGNPIHYTVNFNKNTTDSVDDMPAALDASTTATSIKIPNTVPQRAHYAFTGWCLGTTTTTDGVDTCTDGAGGSGTVFQPGDDFGIDQTTANITTLYAMWRIDTVTVTLTAGTGIDTVAITGSGVKTGGEAGSTSTAEVYYNGEITITATPSAGYAFVNWTGNATYTNNPETIANVTSDLELTANANELTALQDISAAQCNELATDANLVVYDKRDNKDYTVRYINGNCWMTQNLRFLETSLSPTTSNVATEINMTYGEILDGNTTDISRVHVGNDNNGEPTVWYNYPAATAMTIIGSSNSTTATQDICPKGWRLPSVTEFNTVTSFMSAFDPVSGGFYKDKALYSPEHGYWWASTADSATLRNELWYDSTTLNTTNSTGRDRGLYIRCILDSAPIMQNISNNTLDSLVPNTGDSATLRDTRDNQRYTVTKLADGNVWMTQNLRFTGTKLTPADSNVENDTTMIYGDLASGNTFDEARIHISDNSNYGVWYNYAAASAGTITGSSNTNEATSSICPAGWRLPTASEQVDITNYVSTFKPIVGGIYYDNALRNTDYGYWWSSTVYDATLREYLGYNSASTMFTNHTGIGRVNGFYVRCIYDATPIYMQDFSSANAASMATNDLKTLVDNRDNQTYKVAKLADGNIWMIDNLNLNASTITATELDSTNTNLEPGETLAVNIFKGWQTSSATATYNSGQYIPVTGTDSTSLTKNGTLYNYCAASAGTICSSSNSSNATSDICPKGWRLPTGSSTGEYQKLYDLTQYNTLAKMRSPIGNNGAAFALPGYFNTGTPIANTAYWTSMAQGDTKAYAMSINTSSGVTPSNYGERSLGFSVRCIYDKPITMQNFSITDVISMATNEVKTLVDSRDNKKYSVIKLADGNVWMSKNLRFTGTSLTSTDSNVSSNITMSYGELENTASSYDSPKIHIGMDTDNNPTVWYNFAAATAGTITGSSNTNEGAESVCPKGWKLPSRNEISGITSYPTQFNTTRTGYYSNGTLSYTQYGIWWSATANSVTNRYDLNYQNGNFVVGNTGSDRGYGDPIRCVYSRTTISDISTMQDFNSLTNEQKISVKDSMAADTIYTLKDNRDDRSYNVVKLQDGKIWMASDLKLGATALTQDLTSLNTNITDTVPAATYNSWKHSSTSTNTAGKYVTNNTYMLYNYYAISAGTIAGDSNTNNTTYDICPAGWRLMSFDDIQTIYGMSSYNTYSKLRAAPTSFNMSGYFINAGITNTDNEGDYWTSTIGDTTTTMKQFYLRLRGSAVIFLDQERTHGASARCVVK